MSRNLCETSCHQCNHQVVMQEEAREITEQDCGRYFFEYAGMKVANARCVLCGALYLAWCSQPRSWWNVSYGRDTPPGSFFDLSYRHSFNDEPDIRDLPVFKVINGERVGLYRLEDNPYAGWRIERGSESDLAAIEEWRARQGRETKPGMFDDENRPHRNPQDNLPDQFMWARFNYGYRDDAPLHIIETHHQLLDEERYRSNEALCGSEWDREDGWSNPFAWKSTDPDDFTFCQKCNDRLAELMNGPDVLDAVQEFSLAEVEAIARGLDGLKVQQGHPLWDLARWVKTVSG